MSAKLRRVEEFIKGVTDVVFRGRHEKFFKKYTNNGSIETDVFKHQQKFFWAFIPGPSCLKRYNAIQRLNNRGSEFFFEV